MSNAALILDFITFRKLLLQNLLTNCSKISPWRATDFGSCKQSVWKLVDTESYAEKFHLFFTRKTFPSPSLQPAFIQMKQPG